MKVDLLQIELLTDRLRHQIYTGDSWINKRIDGMKNPDGYVASYYAFFYNLATMLKPKVLVELGSWQGTSAACFASGSPSTQVITVDHHSDPGDA